MVQKITNDYALTRGVSKILPTKEALAKLLNKKKLTIYQGFDPTKESLHIGSLVGVRKLAQFQKLGHKIIFLIGDFTAMMGDPSDKSIVRKMIPKEEIKKNFESYKNQIKNIIDFEGANKAEVKYNSEWLAKLNFEEVVKLSSNFTVQQMIERSFFQKRLKNEKPIYLHEFLYPLMQGYDSVAMNIDLEIGGNDQLFNMLAGRTLMKSIRNKEKYVLALKLLESSTGQKMGKTEGNAINLASSPIDLFGQIMALPDSMINPGIELLTDLPLDWAKDKNPMDAKKTLAWEIVKQLNSKVSANKARDEFKARFQNQAGAIKPTQIKVKENILSLNSAVAKARNSSKSQAKRLITQGAVDVNGKTITNPKEEIKTPVKLKIGKATFVKIVS